MNRLQVALLAIQVVAAVMLMMGIRTLGIRHSAQLPPRCPLSLLTSMVLFLVGGLARSSAIRGLIADVPHLVWVGLVGATLTFVVVLALTLRLVGIIRGSTPIPVDLRTLPPDRPLCRQLGITTPHAVPADPHNTGVPS